MHGDVLSGHGLCYHGHGLCYHLRLHRLHRDHALLESLLLLNYHGSLVHLASGVCDQTTRNELHGYACVCVACGSRHVCQSRAEGDFSGMGERGARTATVAAERDDHDEGAPQPNQEDSTGEEVDDDDQNPENRAANTPASSVHGFSSFLLGRNAEAPRKAADDPAHVCPPGGFRVHGDCVGQGVCLTGAKTSTRRRR